MDVRPQFAHFDLRLHALPRHSVHAVGCRNQVGIRSSIETCPVHLCESSNHQFECTPKSRGVSMNVENDCSLLNGCAPSVCKFLVRDFMRCQDICSTGALCGNQVGIRSRIETCPVHCESSKHGHECTAKSSYV